MIRVSTFAGRNVAVVGLGSSGLTAARALADGGAKVACWDDSEAARAAAGKAGAPVEDIRETAWARFDALVLAPGIPLTHPEPHWAVRKARAAGVEIIGDIELFVRERAASAPTAPFIGITGTNGKSTTTALIAHLLRELGEDVQVGGNLGTPVLALEAPADDRFHVLELSSFQIDLAPSLAPMVGVLLNVSPDHLDRHGTIENYAAVKRRLVARAEAACIGVDDTWTRAIAEAIDDPARLYPFTTGRGSAIVPRFYAIGSSLFAHEREGAYTASREVASLDGIPTLRGTHNVQNALAALTALRALQDRLDSHFGAGMRTVWKPEAMQGLLASFPGLPHRLEEVGRRGRVLFINDSKATNADSTEKALSSFDGDIFWILGGKPKDGGITSLNGYLSRIAKAYLVGQATEEFAATLGDKVSFERCGTIDKALAAAAKDAEASGAPAPVVLLSPACASYDQFPNFEVRGDAFRKLVSELPGVEMRARRVP